MLFLHVTSRVQGEKYPRLLSAKGGRGFPYLVYMDAEGKVAAKVNDRSVKGFSELGASLRKYAELMKKQAGGDKTVAKDIWSMKIKLGKFTTAQAARDALKAIEGLSDGDKQAMEQQLTDLDIADVLKTVGRGDRAGQLAVATKFAGWAKAGRVPTSGSRVFFPFWQACLGHAEQNKDVELFEKGLNVLKRKFGKNQRAQRFFKAQQAKLNKMKAASGGAK